MIIDSQKLSGSSGNLTFHGKSKDQGIFELIVGENALAIPLINDASEIQVSADLSKTKDFYTVTGSPASKELQELLDNVGRKNNEIQAAFNNLDSLKKINAPDSVLVSANITKNMAITGIKQLSEKLYPDYTQCNPGCTCTWMGFKKSCLRQKWIVL